MHGTYESCSMCLVRMCLLTILDVKVKAFGVFHFLAQFELNPSAGARYLSAHYRISLSKHPEFLKGSRHHEPMRLNSNIFFECPSPWIP